MTGPYTIADTQELQLAATLDSTTPKGSVFLTFGRPNDPVLAVAGRIGVMGYGGWLWSYGIDIGDRYADVQTMYSGCKNDAATCPIPALLRKYGISYVEIDNRLGDPGAVDSQADPTWWADQGFPVVAHSDHIIIYDVRGQT